MATARISVEKEGLTLDSECRDVQIAHGSGDGAGYLKITGDGHTIAITFTDDEMRALASHLTEWTL